MPQRGTAPRDRAYVRVWILLTACILASFGLWSLSPLAANLYGDTGHDFKLLYAAAMLLRHHQNPYDPATFLNAALAAGLQRVHLVNPLTGQLSQPFVYPPLFAWLVIPFTYMSPRAALLGWRLISLACVFAGTLGLVEAWARSTPVHIFHDRWSRLLATLLITASPLSIYGIYWGNPVALVYGAVGVWTWLLTRHERLSDTLAGVLMSAALLKPQLALPLAIISLFVLTRGPDQRPRRRRVVFSVGGAIVGLLLIDVLVSGVRMLLAWPQSVLYLSRQIFIQPDMPSLLGALQPTLERLPSQVQSSALLGMMLVGSAAVLFLYLPLRNVWQPLALFGLLTVAWCFAAPYAHANDAVLYVPGGLAAVAVLEDSSTTLWIAARSRMGWRLPRALTLPGFQLIVALLGVIILWYGGTLAYIPLSWQLRPLALAPLLLLLGFAIAPARVSQRRDLSDTQAIEPVFVASSVMEGDVPRVQESRHGKMAPD